MTAFVTRFAPSPTGELHLGHAYSAITAYRAARSVNGTFLLRIEDIDAGRCRPNYEELIYHDLQWLGLSWDAPPIRQSERHAHYQSQLQSLIAEGLVYRCFKSRKEIAQHLSAPHGITSSVYYGEPLPPEQEKEHLDAGKAFSWRLSMDALRSRLGTKTLVWHEQAEGTIIEHDAQYETFGDVILARKDIQTSYHLASLYDDYSSGITHVIRGLDLKDVAGLHRVLQHVLGYQAPIYQHHRLITDEGGNRLAKRSDSTSIRMLRDRGMSPSDIYSMLELQTI